jgi:YD repeat-containing protein
VPTKIGGGRDSDHDPRGRIEEPPRTEDGKTVHFEYDTEERLCAVYNAQGQAYRFELGPTGEVDAEITWAGQRKTYQRDLLGRIIERKRASGLTSRYNYDALGGKPLRGGMVALRRGRQQSTGRGDEHDEHGTAAGPSWISKRELGDGRVLSAASEKNVSLRRRASTQRCATCTATSTLALSFGLRGRAGTIAVL